MSNGDWLAWRRREERRLLLTIDMARQLPSGRAFLAAKTACCYTTTYHGCDADVSANIDAMERAPYSPRRPVRIAQAPVDTRVRPLAHAAHQVVTDAPLAARRREALFARLVAAERGWCEQNSTTPTVGGHALGYVCVGMLYVRAYALAAYCCCFSSAVLLPARRYYDCRCYSKVERTEQARKPPLREQIGARRWLHFLPVPGPHDSTRASSTQTGGLAASTFPRYGSCHYCRVG
ncbi:hypothetical protein GGS23DRAFT_270437 [Durotheca rogersii]|uniref:uncharacterized protein n=1 Tax=Durotheca rogersii TaxID=419775 RepID=UPI00221FB89A|nr:uncharacterized protein GGS23DRAFT_270437 [Durotheca rogersii]KAI5866426.1 hypothetical protein GGS23DRAFT_270437 [Durotheca rogersii]